ncbi:DUF6387 family protein [Litorilituus sediminis]|uniref:Uncharacterized protein n=1 Tax=Litorilituus sediminis TaxID=718192 RepID=A0A4P6P8T2_9GAMM|nr:DUF6387 family protein [Litorilituus sediminis]QBG36709.1 hypothetical protein EMK97_13770 [Litorilituus sediminis]
MYLLEVRAKVSNKNLIIELPDNFSLENYKEVKNYSAKTWLRVLSQRAMLLNSIIKFNEIDFTKSIDTFKVSNTELGLSISFKTPDFITPRLDSPIIFPKGDKQFTYEELKSVGDIEEALNPRMNSVVSINRHANPEVLIKELTQYIKQESLWYKSINKVSGRRTRGFYGPDKSYERVNQTRFNRIINKHAFDDLVNYQVLAYIDLTLYALLNKKKYGNKFLDSILFTEEDSGNSQNKKIEKVTQHIANIILMKRFITDLNHSTATSPQ